MKAMILAAGLGTRLGPVTQQMPKALVEFRGRPLIEHAIIHLRNAGVDEIIVNVHHFMEKIIQYLDENDFGIDIKISDESDQLLETGGGLKKAEWFFGVDDPFIVRNVDVISDLDLKDLLKYHEKRNALVTLAVRKRETSRYFLFNEERRLCGWQNTRTGETRWCFNAEHHEKLAFSGIQIMDPRIFPLITEEGKFSLTGLYLRLAKDQMIFGYEEKNPVWMDMGKPESLTK